MEIEKAELKVLDDYYKAIKMGEDSYSMLIEKTTDSEFKELLQKQSNKYEEFLNTLHTEYNKIDEEPTDTPVMQKVMGWTGINLNTLADSSNSHISEILIQGAIMGVIEVNKLLNSNPNLNKDLAHSLSSFGEFQYKIIEELKQYLRK